MAKKKKQKIKVYFRDWKSDTLPQKWWDDYEVIIKDSGAFLAIMKDGQWIAMYNLKDVLAFTVG